MSEADIQAYTDGSLSGEQVARVRRYLERRPGEWHRILFYRRLNAQMQRSFGAAAMAGSALAAPAAPCSPAEATGFAALRRALVVLAIAIALAVAALAWLYVSEPDAQTLNNAAVMALMEAGSSSQPMASPADTLAEVLAPGTRAAGPALFDLSGVGLRFIASGTVELGPCARAQRWIYVNADGQPVVLLAARAWFVRAAPQWSARRVGDLRLIGWIGDGERWVLAGNARTHGLMRAADAATQQMEATTGRADAPPRQ
ncbi:MULTISPECIES: transcriptional regulator [unclassified Paraburkholderia]|uniref:transcriptional regulator n=1 Tax=unclassified Paraburkholderia TaxID=2615204 RepID=UPI002AB117AF|nr:MULTISPECIES: transcriptional regulator [unclassified Paraburkholderia]